MNQFLISRDPQLHWKLLWGNGYGRGLPSFLQEKPIYFFFWARNAIYHGLRALQIPTSSTILVPAYHCATAVEPILRYGARVKFYNIRKDCSPDLTDIERKLDTTTRALLAIHYFGFPQPIRALQDFCRAHKLHLIEDCAHVLVGESEGSLLGTFGDISVFSWRKFLPLHDGGMLVVNNPECSVEISYDRRPFVSRARVAKDIVDMLLEGVTSEWARQCTKLLQVPARLGGWFVSRTAEEELSTRAAVEPTRHGFTLTAVNWNISKIAKYILANVDILSVIEKRRNNYLALIESLSAFPTLLPGFSDLPVGVCPWVFPVLVQERENFHVALRARGIPAFTWGGVIHPSLPIEEFPDADFLYRHLVLLPLHQDIGFEGKVTNS